MTRLLPSLLLLAACSGDAEPVDGTPPPGETGAGPTEAPARCVPLLETQEHWVEGETVVLELSCSSGVDRADYTLRMVQAPPGAALDEVAWSATLPTDLDDAGTFTFTFEVKHVSDAGVPETVPTTVHLTDAGPAVPDNVPPDPLAYQWEFGLPVIHCAPTATVTEAYTPAPCHFQGVEYATSRIKLRGAASLGYPKNSYTLDFPDDKIDLGDFGLNKKENLVLTTTFDDNSYVRQKLVFDLWDDIEDFWSADRVTPDTFFAVLYLDGVYQGLYLGTEHVDAELMGENDHSEDGNLYKAISHDANFKHLLANGSPKTDLAAGYEKKEGLPTDDFSDLSELVLFSAASDDATFWQGAGDYLQVDEFMDWFLLASYTAAADSAGKNAYLYHDPELVDGVFRYMPWDFNHSWGQTWQTERVSVTTYDDYSVQNGIFAHFHAHPEASTELWGRFDAMSAEGGPLHPDALLERLDEYYAEIELSAQRDWEHWGDDYATYAGWSWRTDLTTYDEEKAYLYDWVGLRLSEFETHRP